VVPRIFALTCLDSLIPCFASLKEALAQTPAAANQQRDAHKPTSDRLVIFAGSEAVDQLPPEP
jgi:hypothetical protein